MQEKSADHQSRCGNLQGAGTRAIQLLDGRILGYAEYGDPDGTPVFAFHGTPGSRFMFRIAHEPARKAQIRLIAPERPGFGISSVHKGRTLCSYADDIASLADALGIGRFSVAGISGGGPYAVSCGAILKDRIKTISVVSPVGPVCAPDKPARIGPGHFFAFRIAPRITPFLALICAVGRLGFLYAPQLMYRFILSRASSTDRATLSRADVRHNLLAGVAEGFRPGIGPAMQELRLFSRPWSIAWADITAPVMLWQGLNDRNVSVTAALRLAELIPHCRMQTIHSAGHYWIFNNIETILTEIMQSERGEIH